MGMPPGCLQHDREWLITCLQSFSGNFFSGHSRDSIFLLLITQLLSCCKHPVKILIKAVYKYSSSCYAEPPGCLQHDREWLITCLHSFSGNSFSGHSRNSILLLIKQLLSSCKHPVKILIKAVYKYSSSCYAEPPGCLQHDREWLITCLHSFSGNSFSGHSRDSICLPLITRLLSCCKHPVKVLFEAAYKYSGRLQYCIYGFLGFLLNHKPIPNSLYR